MMGIITSWFFIVASTSISGTTAYAVWRFLLKIAEKKGAFRWLNYSGRLASLFYVIPALYGYYFSRIYNMQIVRGANMGTAFYANGGIADNTIIIKRILCTAFLIWIAGLMSKSIYMILENRRVKNVHIRREDVDEDTFHMLESVRKRLGINKRVQIYYNSEITVPFVKGILRPAIYIPKWIFTEREMEIIISHELFHIKNHDLVWKCILLCLRMIHWFNPTVVYLAKHMVSLEETCCDRDICYGRKIAGYEEYFGIILDNIEKGHEKHMPLTMCLHSDKNELSTRIKRMKYYRTKSRFGRLTAVLLTIVFLSASIFTSATAGSLVEKAYVSVLEATEDEIDEQNIEDIYHETLRIPMQSRITVSSIYANRGQEIHVAIIQQTDNSEVGFGIVNKKSMGRGVLTSSSRNHSFTIYKSDDYSIYVENRNDDSIEIELYYYIAN